MKTIFHHSESRGHAEHGWLNARHSFSFAQWHDPNRIHFGALRVLNDDTVAPSMGFGKHPHNNMEIITIPLKGTLRHQDSMGFTEVVSAGEVQVMSAGTGIFHSEMNASHREELKLFQIWIFPNQQNLSPRYEQKSYNIEETNHFFLPLVTPFPSETSAWIHQNAWIHMATLSENSELIYTIKSPGNGVYIMNIDGVFEVADEVLNQRDAIGIWETDEIKIQCKQNAHLLVIEVPMEF